MVTYGLEVGQGLTGRAVVDHLSHGEHHQAVKQAVDRIAGLVDGEYNGATLHSQPEQNKRKCVIFRSCHQQTGLPHAWHFWKYCEFKKDQTLVDLRLAFLGVRVVHQSV